MQNNSDNCLSQLLITSFQNIVFYVNYLNLPFLPTSKDQLMAPVAATLHQKKKLLDSINTLKRATGIPDSIDNYDSLEGGQCRIFTTDLESAELLAQFFHKVYYGKHTPHFYASRTDKTCKDAIEVCEAEPSCFVVKLPIWDVWVKPFREKIEEITDMHLTPSGKSAPTR